MKVSVGRFACVLCSFLGAGLAGCGPEPAKVEILPEEVILEGVGDTEQLEAKVLDEKGTPIPDFKDIVWFSEDMEHIKLSADGTVKAVSSGEAKVDLEVVNSDIKTSTTIRVKIPGSIKVSHERLRLWTGQVKENVNAEVLSEKGAFIEGYLPTWVSDDPDIVKVEPIVDPSRRQSWVRLTGMKSGSTFIYAKFQHFSEQIRVAVFDEDEEVAMDGTRIPKNKEEEDAAPKKKKKRRKKR